MSGCSNLTELPVSWKQPSDKGPIELNVLLDSEEENDSAAIRIWFLNLLHDYKHDFSLDSVGGNRLSDIGGNIVETIKNMHVKESPKAWSPPSAELPDWHPQYGGNGSGIDAVKINNVVRNALSRICNLSDISPEDAASLPITKIFQQLTGDTPYLARDGVDYARMEFDTAEQLYNNLEQTISDHEESAALMRKGFYIFTEPSDIAEEEKLTQTRLNIKLLEKNIKASQDKGTPNTERWESTLKKLKEKVANLNRDRRLKTKNLRAELNNVIPELKEKLRILKLAWLGPEPETEVDINNRRIYEQNTIDCSIIRQSIDNFTTDTLITTAGYLMNNQYLLNLLTNIAEYQILVEQDATCNRTEEGIEWVTADGVPVIMEDKSGDIVDHMLVNMGIMGFLGDTIKTKYIEDMIENMKGGGTTTAQRRQQVTEPLSPGPLKQLQEPQEPQGKVAVAGAPASSTLQLPVEGSEETEIVENALRMTMYKSEGDPSLEEMHGLFTVMFAAFSALNAFDGSSPISTLLINGQIRSFMKLWIVYCPFMKAFSPSNSVKKNLIDFLTLMKESLSPEITQKGGAPGILDEFKDDSEWKTWVQEAITNLRKQYLAPLKGLSRGATESDSQIRDYLKSVSQQTGEDEEGKDLPDVRQLLESAMKREEERVSRPGEDDGGGEGGGGGGEDATTPDLLPLDYIVGFLSLVNKWENLSLDNERLSSMKEIREVYENTVAPVFRTIVARMMISSPSLDYKALGFGVVPGRGGIVPELSIHGSTEEKKKKVLKYLYERLKIGTRVEKKTDDVKSYDLVVEVKFAGGTTGPTNITYTMRDKDGVDKDYTLNEFADIIIGQEGIDEYNFYTGESLIGDYVLHPHLEQISDAVDADSKKADVAADTPTGVSELGRIVGMIKYPEKDKPNQLRILYLNGIVMYVSTIDIYNILINSSDIERILSENYIVDSKTLSIPSSQEAQDEQNTGAADDEGRNLVVGLWSSSPADVTNYNVTAEKLIRINEILADLDSSKSWGFMEVAGAADATAASEATEAAETTEEIIETYWKSGNDVTGAFEGHGVITLIASLRNLYNEFLLPMVSTRMAFFNSVLGLTDATRVSVTKEIEDVIRIGILDESDEYILSDPEWINNITKGWTDEIEANEAVINTIVEQESESEVSKPAKKLEIVRSKQKEAEENAVAKTLLAAKEWRNLAQGNVQETKAGQTWEKAAAAQHALLLARCTTLITEKNMKLEAGHSSDDQQPTTAATAEVAGATTEGIGAATAATAEVAGATTTEGATTEVAGATEVAATTEGATQEGATQEGATQEGATQEGATQEGATQEGATTQSTEGEGATAATQGAGVTEAGVTEAGVTEAGVTEATIQATEEAPPPPLTPEVASAPPLPLTPEVASAPPPPPEVASATEPPSSPTTPPGGSWTRVTTPLTAEALIAEYKAPGKGMDNINFLIGLITNPPKYTVPRSLEIAKDNLKNLVANLYRTIQNATTEGVDKRKLDDLETIRRDVMGTINGGLTPLMLTELGLGDDDDDEDEGEASTISSSSSTSTEPRTDTQSSSESIKSAEEKDKTEMRLGPKSGKLTAYLPQEGKNLINRVCCTMARAGLKALGMVEDNGHLTTLGWTMLHSYMVFSKEAIAANNQSKSGNTPATPTPKEDKISRTKYQLINILTGLQLFILYKYAWDIKSLWESYILKNMPPEITHEKIKANMDSKLLGKHKLDDRWLFGVLDILGAWKEGGTEKTADDLGVYAWTSEDVESLTNLYAVMQNATKQTTYMCRDGSDACSDGVIPYMCIRKPEKVKTTMVRNGINNSTQSLPSIFKQAQLNADNLKIPYKINILSKKQLSGTSPPQVYSIICPDQSIQDKMSTCSFGAASKARSRYLHIQFFKLAAKVKAAVETTSRENTGGVEEEKDDGSKKASVDDTEEELSANVGGSKNMIGGMLRKWLDDIEIKDATMAGSGSYFYQGISEPIKSSTGIYDYERVCMDIGLGKGNTYSVQHTTSLKSGELMKASYVYKGLLGQLSSIFGTGYEDVSKTKKARMSKNYDQKKYEAIWNTISHDIGTGGLFAELFEIGIVKGGGDFFQEISACWPWGGYLDNHEPNSSEARPFGNMNDGGDWYSTLFPDEWTTKYGFSSEHASIIPDYITENGISCPDAYRWGFMGDRPSGIRPGLFNIYSNLDLFADGQVTNRLNISGYLGLAKKLGKVEAASSGNSFGPPDSVSTFFVANKYLLEAIVNAKDADGTQPAFISKLLNRDNGSILPGTTQPNIWRQAGGKKKHKFTRRQRRKPKKTRQKKIKHKKESLKQFKKRTKTRVRRLKIKS